MAIEFYARGQFEDDLVEITVSGSEADTVVNLILARLLAAEYEVLLEGEDGDLIPWEDVDHE